MTQPNTIEVAAPQRIVLLPGEIDTYSMEFARRLGPGETISSVTSTAVGGNTTPALTLGTATVSGTQVKIPLSGGLAGNTYQIQVLILTSLSRSIKGLGWLVMPTIPS